MILSITCKIVVTVARPEFFSRVESEIKAVVLTLLQLQLLNAVIRNQKIKTGQTRDERGTNLTWLLPPGADLLIKCSEEKDEEDEGEEPSHGKSHWWLWRTWRRMIVRWRHQ